MKLVLVKTGLKRINMLNSFFQSGVLEAGCDEAGRGCLAGPVFAAAVIFPDDYQNADLNDSKTLTIEKRIALRSQIERDAIAFSVAQVEVSEIEKINILNASILAMHRALDQLSVPVEHLLVDGNKFKAYKDVPHQCIVKGDATYLSIAAASVLAKTYRDDYMVKLAARFPAYCWHENKGYGTKKHRDAILKHGSTIHHRQLFLRKLLNTTVE